MADGEDRVSLVEVGPRDGLQSEDTVLSTVAKVKLIACLISSGLKRIQAVSFVHPKKVPQMADAEDVIHSLPQDQGVEYSALVLNQTGLDRALRTSLSSIEVSLSASNTHSQKNAGMSRYDALEQAKAMIRRAKMHGLTVRTSVQCAVGCVFEGTIDRKVVAVMAQDLMEAGADSLALADTTGMGHPGSIRALLEEIEKKLPQLPIALHLHDTLGLGLVNLMTGLECGVRCFDTSCGGLGGCPFVPGAAGNIATEDTVYFLHTLGYTTGVDWSKTAFCTQELEQILGRRLPAKLRQNVFKSLS